MTLEPRKQWVHGQVLSANRYFPPMFLSGLNFIYVKPNLLAVFSQRVLSYIERDLAQKVNRYSFASPSSSFYNAQRRAGVGRCKARGKCDKRCGAILFRAYWCYKFRCHKRSHDGSYRRKALFAQSAARWACLAFCDQILR